MSSSAVDDLLLSLGLSTCSQYEYSNVDNFASVLDNEYKLFEADNLSRSQYIVFRGLNQSLFDRDFLYPRSGALTFESYFPNLDLLLVKMEFEPHSTAARKFEALLTKHLVLTNNDNLDRKLTPIGTAHFRTIDRTKRADASFRPRRLGTSHDGRWPSLVVEVGFSEPYRKLKEDAKWWLTKSQHNEVKTVVVIKINQTYREIVIEKWICQGQETTKDYRTVLSQQAGRNDIDISNNQPFIIPFDDLFLRTATPPKERDIIIGADDWEDFADTVWEVQFEQDYKKTMT
ncbi:hypothetical protein ZTR_08381 [Talaromyces verruculosus]|nr:hypothetical protein ZTR_08381 [Talaromyces verruculosus]